MINVFLTIQWTLDFRKANENNGGSHNAPDHEDNENYDGTSIAAILTPIPIISLIPTTIHFFKQMCY